MSCKNRNIFIGLKLEISFKHNQAQRRLQLTFFTA